MESPWRSEEDERSSKLELQLIVSSDFGPVETNLLVWFSGKIQYVSQMAEHAMHNHVDIQVFSVSGQLLCPC